VPIEIRAAWPAAYAQIIDPAMIDRVTGPGGAANIRSGLGDVEELRYLRDL
jgi:hypothetical protein